jgi:hypothetical protein
LRAQDGCDSILTDPDADAHQASATTVAAEAAWAVQTCAKSAHVPYLPTQRK